MNLIGYVRVSTKGQAQDGESLEEQRQRLLAYCAAHGHTLVTTLADEGVSGTVAPREREGLRHALMALNEGAYGAKGLVAFDLSRLSRSISDVLALFAEAEKKGWHLFVLRESIDTSNAAGRLMLNMMAAVNQFTRDNISERTSLALQHRKDSGLAYTRTPFGLRRASSPDGGTAYYEPVHAEQRILRTICRWRRAGRGYKSTLRALLRIHKRNPRTGRPFPMSWLRSLVNNNSLDELERRASTKTRAAAGPAVEQHDPLPSYPAPRPEHRATGEPSTGRLLPGLNK